MSTEYPQPMVTISLAEYQELKAVKDTITGKEKELVGLYKKAMLIMLEYYAPFVRYVTAAGEKVTPLNKVLYDNGISYGVVANPALDKYDDSQLIVREITP